MPTPAPATVEILRGYPVVLTAVAEELTTPTGAAVIKALSSGTLRDEAVVVDAVGYGAGTKEFPALPNLLRVLIGTLPDPVLDEEVVILETNIDDMNPQVYPVLLERLLHAGACDAFFTPVVMKKGRPGILLSALVPAADRDRMINVILRETTSIGVRMHPVARRTCARREAVVSTSFGPVRVKVVLKDDTTSAHAEFEECRRIAEERGLPLLQVMTQIQHEIRNSTLPVGGIPHGGTNDGE